ncbi:hypothetical protein [Corallococcus sp. RDP092CA]|uniref:hypothetical protein n=1 Tax=Corallococcus sp. RDP092CA TaxID=3109369 RepID=UPI0035AEAD69
MKTLLVAALLAASASTAAPTPTAEATAPAASDIQADPHAPSKHEEKEAKVAPRSSGRAEKLLRSAGNTGARQKPLKRPTPTKPAR